MIYFYDKIKKNTQNFLINIWFNAQNIDFNIIK